MTLHDGLALIITLSDDIPADAATGSPVHFTVAKDLEAGDGVSIRRGASVKGEIAQEGKKKFLGIGGKMMFRLLSVESADGKSLALRATLTHRESAQAWRPIESGGRNRPKGVAATAGSQYPAYIDGDQTVTVRK